jgi:DNA-binding response OmpR family regulator
LTRRPKNKIVSTLVVDDLTLDTVTYEVKRADKVIVLSNKEFALLAFLMRHARQIVKKDQIIKQVWDYDADVLPNTVEVYIKHLREKIDSAGFKKKIIHTIRGFGYKLGDPETSSG